MFLALVSVSTLHLQFIWFWALPMFPLKDDLTTSYIVEKPCVTLELLELQGRLREEDELNL